MDYNELEALGFNTEFMSDADVEEMLDNLVTTVGNKAIVDDNKPAVINPERIQQLLYTYKIVKYLTKGTKAKVSYTLHEPYKSMGYVSVTGSSIQFGNTEWFLKAVELASNFEVFPKTDGTVEMNFTFHGLTKMI